MEEYKYYDDMVDAMVAIDGNYPVNFSILYDEKGPSKVVEVKITPKELIIYPKDPNLTIQDLHIIKIKLDDIEFFQEEGEVYREQVISGGGSGKINVGGAIVGDILAGPAGMILGGQRKVEEIKSETVTHDTRKIVLSYFLNKKSKIRRKLFFSKDIKQFFSDNIPEKEFSIVELNKKKKLVDNNNNANSSVKDKMKELNEMLKENLITQEEYDEKKKALLDCL